jgi:two-component system sensor histidine kinase RegB
MLELARFPEASNLRLNQRRAIVLRWWLLAAVVFAVSAAPGLLDIALPRLPMFAVVLLVAAFNARLQWRAGADEAIGPVELFGQLAVDLVALGILLYLSGGAANPLISFLLVPVAVAALSLPGRLTAAVALLAIAIYTLLMWVYLPLPVADAERAARLHLGGMWLTFVGFSDHDRLVRGAHDGIDPRARHAPGRGARTGPARRARGGAGRPRGRCSPRTGDTAGDHGRGGGGTGTGVRSRCRCACRPGPGAGADRPVQGNHQRHGGAQRQPPRPDQVQAQDAVDWVRGVRARWQAMRPRASSRVTDRQGAPVRRAFRSKRRWNRPWPTCSTMRRMPAIRAKSTFKLAWDAATLRIAVADCRPGLPAEVLRGAGTGAAAVAQWRCRYRPAAGIFGDRAIWAGASCWPIRRRRRQRQHRTADCTEGAGHDTGRVGRNEREHAGHRG